MQATGRRLEGKVAVVTGGGTSGPGVGTGRAMSVLFAREGARVLLVDVVTEHAERTLAEITQEGGEASILQADVSSAMDCELIARTVFERYGALHVLVNNVGTAGPGSVVEVSEEEWDRIFAVNLRGMMLTSKYTIPLIAASGGGSIINIASVAGVRGTDYFGGVVAYSASKGGVVALTQSMAVNHGTDGVRVNCIVPGQMYTPMASAGGRMSEEERSRRRLAAPLQTEGDGWDVGWAAVYLASDEARWVTGVALPVDGGLLAKLP